MFHNLLARFVGIIQQSIRNTMADIKKISENIITRNNTPLLSGLLEFSFSANLYMAWHSDVPAHVEKFDRYIRYLLATERITTLMKEKDALFRNMYERKFYGGSYYDGIKVGKPEEYDLDYVLNLPLIIEPTLEGAKDKPGFVHVRITEYMKLLKRDEASKFEKLDTLMDTNNYLSTFKVLQWIEKIITLAFNGLHKVPDKGYMLEVKLDDKETIPVYANLSKSFPAFTLKLKNADGTINLDIDLVPCFQFTDGMWPSEADGYRPNPFPKRNKFLVVPKKPHGMDDSKTLERYWRLSFQEQERELIKGHAFRSMKPTIKLLKKLRDKQNHVKIASYFIKTIFLWEVQTEPLEFWQHPSSYVLMMMLKKYADMVQSKCIPYFWNEGYNLIGHLKEVTLTDIGNTLRNIVVDIERNIDVDPFVAAKYLIDQDQVETLRNEVDLGKKHIKKLKITQCLTVSSPSVSMDETDSGCALSDDDKVKRLLINDDFLQEVAEHISIYLKPKLYGVESTATPGGIPSEDETKDAKANNEILNSLHDMHAKTDKIVDMIAQLSVTCDVLTDRVFRLESSHAELRAENSRLRTELRKDNSCKDEAKSKKCTLDHLFALDRLGFGFCEEQLPGSVGEDVPEQAKLN